MLSKARDAAAGLRRNPGLVAVIAEGFLARLAFSVISFTLPFYALALGMSLVEVGVLTALRVAIALLMKPVMGHIAASVGVKRVYLASIVGRTVVALLFLLATTPLGLFLVRALHGLTTAARDPTSAFLVMEHSDERYAARAFSWYTTAKTTGAALGFPLAGILLTATNDAYWIVFVFAAAISALSLLSSILYIREHAPEPETAEPSTTASETPLTTPTKPAEHWGRYATLALLVALPATMVSGLFPLIVAEQTDLDKAEIALVYTASTLVLIVVGPWFGWFADHVSRSSVLAVRSVANILSSIVYAAGSGFWSMSAARMLDDAGKAAFSPAWGSVMRQITKDGDKRDRARRLSYLDTAESIGEAMGPVLASALWQYGGILWLFAVRIVIAIAAEIYAYRLLRTKPANL